MSNLTALFALYPRFYFIKSAYGNSEYRFLNGFDDDVERAVGKLLGYKAEDVEYYIQHHRAVAPQYPTTRIDPIPNAKEILQELGF